MESGNRSSPFLYMNECIQCQSAKNGGVEAFIAHLAFEHSIPTEWPSDRAARLTGAEAKRPYTTVAATRKKRRKLTTPRPLNSFMVGLYHSYIYWRICCWKLVRALQWFKWEHMMLYGHFLFAWTYIFIPILALVHNAQCHCALLFLRPWAQGVNFSFHTLSESMFGL